MNRIDRVTAILIQLQTKRVVKAQAIADRFNISLRTVYRDIRALEEAGVPVLGEAGVGYSLMEGYRLPPVMFSAEEATALLTAEKLVEKYTDAATSALYQDALYKIKAVLRGHEKEELEKMDEKIEVLRNHMPLHQQGTSRNVLQTILKSISQKQSLRMQYRTVHTDADSQRIVEPIGVFHSTGHWYMIAFCQLRNDYRHFRLDSVRQLSLLDEAFTRPHPSLKAYLDMHPRQQEMQTVVVRIQKSLARYLHESKYQYGFVSQTELDDAFEMTFLVGSLEYFIRWYICYADQAIIVQPEELKGLFKEIAGKILQKA